MSLKNENERLKEHNDKLIRVCLKMLEDWWPLVYDRTCRETVRAQGEQVRKAIANE